jgi:hypothetical protein
VPPEQLALLANWTFPALQQAGVRYRWRGEETIGMLERSSPMDKIGVKAQTPYRDWIPPAGNSARQ